MRYEVREAFGDGIAVIWRVMAGIAGLGLIASLFMKGLPLHTQVDKRWGLREDGLPRSDSENIDLKEGQSKVTVDEA